MVYLFRCGGILPTAGALSKNLIAEGETHVLRVYHLDRGYENLEGKLAGAGIDVRREEYQE